MASGNESSRLRVGLEFIGGRWMDKYIRASSQTKVALAEESRVTLTKGPGSGGQKKAQEKEMAKPDRSVVLLVIGLAFAFMIVVWVFWILLVVLDEDSAADKILLLATNTTSIVLTGMFSAAGIRLELLKGR